MRAIKADPSDRSHVDSLHGSADCGAYLCRGEGCTSQLLRSIGGQKTKLNVISKHRAALISQNMEQKVFRRSQNNDWILKNQVREAEDSSFYRCLDENIISCELNHTTLTRFELSLVYPCAGA